MEEGHAGSTSHRIGAPSGGNLSSPFRCWICGGPANSGEHTLKASNIRDYFSLTRRSHRLFRHGQGKKNQVVQGPKSDALKSPARICQQCNNSLTQPYDLAWDQLFAHLHHDWLLIAKNGEISLSQVFPNAVAASSLDVHLRFVKTFGCLVVEGSIPIDTAPLATALRQRVAHPGIALCIVKTPRSRVVNKFARVSDVETWQFPRGTVELAAYVETYAPVSIRVEFSTKAPKLWSPNAWHPSAATDIVKLGNYQMWAKP